MLKVLREGNVEKTFGQWYAVGKQSLGVPRDRLWSPSTCVRTGEAPVYRVLLGAEYEMPRSGPPGQWSSARTPFQDSCS